MLLPTRLCRASNGDLEKGSHCLVSGAREGRAGRVGLEEGAAIPLFHRFSLGSLRMTFVLGLCPVSLVWSVGSRRLLWLQPPASFSLQNHLQRKLPEKHAEGCEFCLAWDWWQDVRCVHGASRLRTLYLTRNMLFL